MLSMFRMRARTPRAPPGPRRNLPRTIEIQLTDGTVVGMGMQGGAEVGAPIVCSKLEQGSPAAKAGTLFIGDEILTVNGVDVGGMLLEDMTAMLQSQLRDHSRPTLCLMVRHSCKARRMLTSEGLLSGAANGVVSHHAPALDRVLAIPLAMCTAHLDEQKGMLCACCARSRGRAWMGKANLRPPRDIIQPRRALQLILMI